MAYGWTTVKNGCFTSPYDGRDGLALDEEDIVVNQGESSVTLECPEDMSSQAYAALFTLGGYTYYNVIEEGSEEHCNSVNEGEENTDDD